MAVIGSPPGAFPQLTITQSQTWVPPQDGNVCFHAVGAGGGGCGYYATYNAGGAGAYFKIPTLAVTTDGSYTLVVGVAGLGSTNGATAGTGGATQISGTNLTGTKSAGGGTGAASAIGNHGVGGQFSGSGQSVFGYTGGYGGQGSGGAVGVFATGQAGAQVANKGGVQAGGRTDAAAGGLGMSGFGIICGGSKRGNDGYHSSGTTAAPYSLDGDDLCGASGMHSEGVSTADAIGGQAGIGGGGGGAKNVNSSNRCFGGQGGDGIILIQYLPW